MFISLTAYGLRILVTVFWSRLLNNKNKKVREYLDTATFKMSKVKSQHTKKLYLLRLLSFKCLYCIQMVPIIVEFAQQ